MNQQELVKNYQVQNTNAASSSAEQKDKTKQKTKQKPSSIIYAVFTTPQNAIPGSAVCAFHIDDIIESFEGK